MKAYEARAIRGRIMKILDINYPQLTGDHLISEILTDVQYCCSPPQVKAYLVYLQEKGYVELRDVDAPDIGIKRCLVKLTARGKDLLEGSIDADPGVDLDG